MITTELFICDDVNVLIDNIPKPQLSIIRRIFFVSGLNLKKRLYGKDDEPNIGTFPD